MRTKKRLLISMFIVGIIVLGISFFCHFKSFYDFWVNLWLAIFGGAVVGFIMALSEYFSEKRRDMELFWVEVTKALRHIYRFQFFHKNDNVELVINCLHELKSNNFAVLCGRSKKSNAKDELLKSLLGDEIDNIKTETDVECADEIYTHELEGVIENLLECINSYKAIRNFNWEGLDFAFGNLDFIFGNRSIRRKIAGEVYGAISDIQKEVQDHFRFFDLINSEHYLDAPICIERLSVLAENLFTVECMEMGNRRSMRVRATKYDYLIDLMDKFRTKMYLGAKRTKFEPTYIVGYVLPCNREETL